MERPIPVFILAGFLGSGKTTLLSRALRYKEEQRLKPAVVMNELGEVNLDGVAVGMEVPMAEILDGCICCTVRGDLGISIQMLVKDWQPDVIFIEATGAANPMEILDGVTEASLYTKVEMKGVVTVVDAALLADQTAKGKGKTYRLLEEQIRSASVLVLNKTDLVDPASLANLEDLLKKWNAHARIIPAVRADADLRFLDDLEGLEKSGEAPSHAHSHEEHCGHEHHDGTCGCGHNHDHAHDHAAGDQASPHYSHDHVMVYTRYLSGPVDSTAFEELVGRLPESVYRAKGVLTFSDTANRYLFQYAYRQADFMRITPQVNVPDVAVFIGEHIPKELLESELERLEREAGKAGSGPEAH